MSDQCRYCTAWGDLKTCKSLPCQHHDNWYAVAQQEIIDQYEKDLAKILEVATALDKRYGLSK